MPITYNLPLVIVSAFIAIVAAYIALEVSSKLFQAPGSIRHFWLACGAIAMGTGIWSMHFVAMLAFSIPIYITYNVPLVLLSWLLAILAALQAFLIVSQLQPTLSILIGGGSIMGMGIALMHYTGMAAMIMPAQLRYHPGLFCLSVAIAVIVSFVALKLSLLFRSGRRSKRVGGKLATAGLMGSAVLFMHYTGMSAAIFVPNFTKGVGSSGLDNTWLAYLVSGLTFLTLGVMAASLFSDSLTEAR